MDDDNWSGKQHVLLVNGSRRQDIGGVPPWIATSWLFAVGGPSNHRVEKSAKVGILPFAYKFRGVEFHAEPSHILRE